ncbi:MAG TPA: hypothetical protein DCK98_02820 [Chloroflexi bacterium]|nr:hypothetical protein [Chloroflexota bacterium]HAL28011.1 hypothetical protein [Chloroflexota bacterium]
MVDRLVQIASGRALLVAVLVFLAYAVFAVLRGPYAEAGRRAGEIDLLEPKWVYPANGAGPLLDRLGAGGRAVYRDAQLVDLLFPVLELPVVALALLCSVRWRGLPRWAAAVTLPLAVFGGAVDWTENVGILRLLDAYPAEPAGVASWLAFATPTKLALAFGSAGVGALGLVSSLAAHFLRSARK